MPKANSEASHTFQLRPLSKPYYYDPISVSFAPLSHKPIFGRECDPPSKHEETGIREQEAGSESSREEPVPVTPLFNKDRKHYTACFINPVFHVQEIDALLLASHNERVRESLRETPLHFIMVAKPRQKINNYCSVCRDYYQDYLEHIDSSDHRKAIKEAKFAKHIVELVRAFRAHEESLKIQTIDQSKLQEIHEGSQTEEGVLTRAARRRKEPEVLELDRPKKRVKVFSRNRNTFEKQELQQAEETGREAKHDQSAVLK